MKATAALMLAVLFSLTMLAGCSSDTKDQTIPVTPTKDPPKDVKPKMMDGKPVGFQ